MIILNEYEYALKILKEHIVGNKPSETLSVLARYYRHKENKKDKEIYNLLNSHMMNFYPNYNPVKWTETLLAQVRKSKKYPLIEIDSVPIMEAELSTIQELCEKNDDNIRLRRLAFTLLACAKFYNLRNEKNNSWVNRERKEIFKLANITATIKDQCKMIFSLKEKGFISLSKKVDNTNLKVEFINDESDIVLRLDDFRELGLSYMEHVGVELIRCQKCGRLMNPKSKNKKYCKDCAGYQPIEYKTLICEDCGKPFVVKAKNQWSSKCPDCYKKYRQEYKANNEKERYNNKKMKFSGQLN